MVVQPKLLILDEPLSGLDPVGRKDVVDILNEYKDQGGAIFFTSHVLHDVERIADRFGFINKGELVTVRSPRELAAGRVDSLLAHFNAPEGFAPEAKRLRDGEFEQEITQMQLPEFAARLSMAGGHILRFRWRLYFSRYSKSLRASPSGWAECCFDGLWLESVDWLM
jgi:ABC-2 type transport system ATP-binding protein